MSCKYANLKVSPNRLEFEVAEGSQFIPPRQDFYIEKDGSGRGAHWNISSTVSWLSGSPTTGSGRSRIRVSCATRGLEAGDYHGELMVSSHVPVANPTVEVFLAVIPKEVPPPPDPEPEPDPDPLPPEFEPPPPDPDPEPEPPEEEEEEEENWFLRFLRWLSDLLRGGF